MKIRKVIKSIPIVDNLYVKWKWRERRITMGKENPDKTFYVIRRATCKVGLFSYVMTNMGLVKQALKNGYIPVIDMQHNMNTYLEKEELGINNAWEFFFEQPCGFSLKDVSHSKNVILSNGLITKKSIYPGKEITENRELCAEWRTLFAKYLRVRGDISGEVDVLYNKLFEGKRVLGVLCRGTDYINNRPKNHPVQPEPGEVIKKAVEVMEQYSCELLYLATEDEGIYQKFKVEFGEKLRVTQAKRCDESGNANINDIGYQRDRDRYLKGKEYLENILLLAKCNCLVAGSVGGTYGALLMSKGYEYEYVYDLGIY